MRISEYLNFTPMRIALAALALAFAFVLWALVDAYRAAPVAPATARPAALVALKSPPVPSAIDIDAAVDNDVFSPDRSAPDEPFRMPGEAAASSIVVTTVRPTVLGTAVAPGGASFATAQLGGGQPRIVRPGDRMGEYTVATIGRGHVVFTASGGTRIDIAASAAPTQGPSNVSNFPTRPFADSSGVGPFFGRGAARRGRGAARGNEPPG
jgi:hypothetical protein